MFKNLTVLQFACDKQIEADVLNPELFAPCIPSQPLSYGFVPPRDDHGVIVEYISGAYVLKACIEEKTIPADVLKRKVKERCDEIEKESGRRPGHKYRKELKEELIQTLLPSAFPRRAEVSVWIFPNENLIFINSTSKKQIGLMATLLVNSCKGLVLADLTTKEAPINAMTDWILNGAPSQFTVDMDCKVKSDSELKSSLAYSRVPLEGSGIRDYIEQGMRPVQLALTWKDRVSFVLTDKLTLKRIEFLDVVFDEVFNYENDDPFDADTTIGVGELLPLILDLIGALGGKA